MWSANQIFCLVAQNKGAIKPSFSPTLLREESRLRDERNVLLRDTTATNNLFNFTCGKNGHRSLQSCLRRNGFLKSCLSVCRGCWLLYFCHLRDNYWKSSELLRTYTGTCEKEKQEEWLIPVDYVNKILCRVRTLSTHKLCPFMFMHVHKRWVRLRPTLVAL